MFRKGSEMEKKDKEVLLDLDYEGSIKSYGSLQNGSFSTPKSVSTLLLWKLQYAALSHSSSVKQVHVQFVKSAQFAPILFKNQN